MSIMGGKPAAPKQEPIPDPAAPRADNATASVASLIGKVRKRANSTSPATAVNAATASTTPGTLLGTSRPVAKT